MKLTRVAFTKQALIWTASFLFLSLIAISINFSWVQASHNADSLLTALISIDRYTPYYWGENRYGQPIALVMSLIRGYTANLFATTLVLVSSSLGCAVLFNLSFLHRGLTKLQRMACALLSISIALCVLSPAQTSLHLVAIGAQPYMPSLFLMLAALTLVFRVEAFPSPLNVVGALACLSVAFWLNSSLALFTAGLLVLLDLDLRNPQWRRRLHGLAVAAVALIANSILSSQYPGPRLLAFVPPRDWFLGMLHMGRHVWPYVFHVGRLLAFVALLLAVFMLKRAWHGLARDFSVRETAAFAVTSCAYAATIGASEWVAVNRHSPRYLAVPVMIFLLTCTAWISGTVIRWLSGVLRSESRPLFCAGCLLAALVFWIFGLPSYSKASAYLTQNTNRYDADLRALGCTHFVGDYWIGWTAVFHRESTMGPPIYALSRRSEVTRDRWDWPPERPRTYCGLQGDPDRESWIRAYGLPDLHETTRSGILCKLEAVPSQSGGNRQAVGVNRPTAVRLSGRVLF